MGGYRPVTNAQPRGFWGEGKKNKFFEKFKKAVVARRNVWYYRAVSYKKILLNKGGV